MQKKNPDIIFENDDFLVLNKPAGLLSIPDRMQTQISLKDMLLEKYGQIFTVHRLDKETSGIILFAKNETAHLQLSTLFEKRGIQKFYLGLVHGPVLETAGSIHEAIMEHPAKNGSMCVHAKGKAAHTDYWCLEKFRSFSWLSYQIHTGRTHQVRVHSAHIGHPIVADKLYGADKALYISSLKKNFHLAKKEEMEQPILSRLALHAAKIIFTWDKREMIFEAPLPKDLKATLQQLRKWNS